MNKKKMNKTDSKTSKFLTEHEVVLEEPWIRLHTGKELEYWGKEEEIRWNQTHRQREKYQFYLKAFDFLTDNKITGDYFEFGCHRGRTFRMALTEARHHNLTDMHFLAFDSFAGLPANLGEHGIGEKWKGGTLVTTENQFMDLMRQHGLYLDKIKTYPGFYDQSLNAVLIHQLQREQHQAAFICVDCDLYKSAVPVFEFIENYLQEGTVIYIDDYWTGYHGNPNKGVSQAFAEYRVQSEWKFAEYLDISWSGKSFVAHQSQDLK